MTDRHDRIRALIARLELSTGPDRDLDADIAEQVQGWKPARVAADYDGENASEILTPEGRLIPHWSYPPRGKIPRAYHVPQFTSDPAAALRFAGITLNAREILIKALRAELPECAPVDAAAAVKAKAAALVRSHAARLGMDSFAAEQLAKAIEAITTESQA